jgi:hypothetical protein
MPLSSRKFIKAARYARKTVNWKVTRRVIVWYLLEGECKINLDNI